MTTPRNTDLQLRAAKVVKRLDFHACAMLVFIRPDGVLDCCPEFTERAAALLRDGAADAAGYVLVGVYATGASTEQIAADAREARG